MPFKIIRNDITKVHADAIVNTANPDPTYGAGTDSAIYRAAGEKKLLAERRKIGRLEAGEAVVTPAFRLHAKYIIHTVGPVWVDGEHREFELLASCYRKSLQMARHLQCRSIAFPLISTGSYGFPRDKALNIALDQISSFLKDEEMDVSLVVFDRKTFELSSDLKKDVSQYIDDNYVEDRIWKEYGSKYIVRRGLEGSDSILRYLKSRQRSGRPADEMLAEREQVPAPGSEKVPEPVAEKVPEPVAGEGPEEYSAIFQVSSGNLPPDHEEPFLKEDEAYYSKGEEPENAGPEGPESAPSNAPGTDWSGVPGDDFPEKSESAPSNVPGTDWYGGQRTDGPAGPESMPSNRPGYGTDSSRAEDTPQNAFADTADTAETVASRPHPGRKDAKLPAAGKRPSGRPAPKGERRIESGTSVHRRSLQDVMSHLGESFQECLLRMIDERSLTDTEVYKRANLDRKLFSKIRCKADYNPSRRTVIALVIALELNMDEAVDLLQKAGMALSPGSKFDLIISYCIQNEIYDIYRVNALLFDYDQPLLGAV